MPFPDPVSGVPRAQVGAMVQAMLGNPSVSDVLCKEDADGTYTVTPRRSTR